MNQDNVHKGWLLSNPQRGPYKSTPVLPSLRTASQESHSIPPVTWVSGSFGNIPFVGNIGVSLGFTADGRVVPGVFWECGGVSPCWNRSVGLSTQEGNTGRSLGTSLGVGSAPGWSLNPLEKWLLFHGNPGVSMGQGVLVCPGTFWRREGGHGAASRDQMGHRCSR